MKEIRQFEVSLNLNLFVSFKSLFDIIPADEATARAIADAELMDRVSNMIAKNKVFQQY